MNVYKNSTCFSRWSVRRYEDIIAFLEEKYDAKTIEINWSLRFFGTTDIKYPVGRIVLTRGMLQGDKFFMSREEQKRRLENEGLEVVSGGANGDSLKIKDYKEYLFDFKDVMEE